MHTFAAHPFFVQIESIKLSLFVYWLEQLRPIAIILNTD